MDNIFFGNNKVDISVEKAKIWRVCNQLRGPYGSTDYANIIIPLTVLRRFDCATLDTKAKVLKEYTSHPDISPKGLVKIAGKQFYNTSPFTFEKLVDDVDNIYDNWEVYLDGYSENVKNICKNICNNGLLSLLQDMHKKGVLYSVTQSFSDIDLSPTTCDSIKMGYIFEDLIGRKYQDANAGEQYTGRDIIWMLIRVLMSEGCDDIFNPGKIITICDQAAGTGGMLSTAYSYIKHYNPKANIQLFGQEINPVAYAIGLAEMLIKDQDASNYMHVNTLKKDCFPNQDMRFVIMNPPFGQGWGNDENDKGANDDIASKAGQEAAVIKEAGKDKSRWGHGLPKKSDGQLIFMQSAINKLAKNGRAAIIENSSPLFNGDCGSGESQVRRWMLESDLLEAIIALPTDLFYNTSIQTYAWIISKEKRKERKGKIQLIDASSIFHSMNELGKKSMGNKRREFTEEDVNAIVKLYKDFDSADSELSKVLPNTYFMYRDYTIKQPLQRSYAITEERIKNLLNKGKLSNFYDESKIYAWENDDTALDQKELDKREKTRRKFKENKAVYDKIMKALKSNCSDRVYLSPEEFKPVIDKVLADTGATDKLIDLIADGLSVMDKNAKIQTKHNRKTKQNEILYDDETAENEQVPYDVDIEDYMSKEVLPYVPDAKWFFEDGEIKNKKVMIKIGAEIPFTRLFYKHSEPKNPDDLETELKELDNLFDKAFKEAF